MSRLPGRKYYSTGRPEPMLYVSDRTKLLIKAGKVKVYKSLK